MKLQWRRNGRGTVPGILRLRRSCKKNSKEFEQQSLAVNSLTEVAVENPPSAIELADGTVIWRT